MLVRGGWWGRRVLGGRLSTGRRSLRLLRIGGIGLRLRVLVGRCVCSRLCSGCVWRCVLLGVLSHSRGIVCRWLWVRRRLCRVGVWAWFTFAAGVFVSAVGASPTVCCWIVGVVAGGAWCGFHNLRIVFHVVRMIAMWTAISSPITVRIGLADVVVHLHRYRFNQVAIF